MMQTPVLRGPALARGRRSNPTAGDAVEIDLGKAECIGVFGNWIKERKKPISLFPSRRHFAWDAQSFGLGLAHDDRFIASVSHFSTDPSRNRTPTERMVDLAGSGMQQATGMAFTVASIQTVSQHDLTYGFGVRQQQNHVDIMSAQTPRRNETIGSVFLAFRFQRMMVSTSIAVQSIPYAVD
jgi:hypothetical protein